MIPVIFTDAGVTYNNRELTQYDYNQKMQITGITIPGDPQIHFARKGMEAIVKIPEVTEEGEIIVDIPNSILKYDGEMTVYLYSVDASTGKTQKSITFYVKPREKPEGYIDQEDNVTTLTDEYIKKNTPGDSTEEQIAALWDAVTKLTLSGLGAL